MIDNIILYEDRDILVMNKKAGIASESKRIGQIDMLTLARKHCSRGTDPSGIPPAFPALIHRLDQPVAGILLLAKNKKSAAILSEELRKGGMQKEYLALCQILPQGAGLVGEGKTVTLVDYLEKAPGSNLSRITNAGTKGAKKAVLSFQREDILSDEAKYSLSVWFPGLSRSFSPSSNENGKAMPDQDKIGNEPGPDIAAPFLREEALALVRINLKTGRHHQIRLQLSHAGLPILGDRKYGIDREDSVLPAPSGLCLTACGLSFTHPSSNERMNFTLPFTSPIQYNN
ncbi:MAG: RluA family pseudouridine synthase [Lachnospiraceae bacterium]|nr:RluA family pseudouridine synthase [Lachnospiraceae bacterium]